MSEQGENVKVATIVRPLNDREKASNAEPIIKMQTHDKGSTTVIVEPTSRKERTFPFDYSFNCCDDGDERGPLASADHIFEQVGRPVLDAAMQGKNVCLFAYGQTGAGKTHAMLGRPDPPEARGIIPRTCENIFSTIAADEAAAKEASAAGERIESSVRISVVEVYCEKVNDLLLPRKQWPSSGFKLKLQPDGSYSAGATEMKCDDMASILRAFAFSHLQRSVGSHDMNASSSRAHTIYSIQYERKTLRGTKVAKTLRSSVNLVDLAGSERSSTAGTSGQMLQEGSAINQSLTTLSKCIVALADAKKGRPPFRESKLTQLLKGAMENGIVLMVAALSPADINHDETLSTLRFADTIKKVKIVAKNNVVESPADEVKKQMATMRAALEDEIAALKQRLESAGGQGGSADADGLAEELQRKEEEFRQQASMQEADFAARLAEAEQRAMDRLREEWAAVEQLAVKVDESRPHFRNLAEDERINEMVSYAFDEGVTKLGRSDGTADGDGGAFHEFSGVGVLVNHASVRWDPSASKLELSVAAKNARVVVNGGVVKPNVWVRLKHNARVMIASSYLFRVYVPGQEEDAEPGPDGQSVTWGSAMQEATAALDAARVKPPNISAELDAALSAAFRSTEQADTMAKDLGADATFRAVLSRTRLSVESEVFVEATLGGQLRLWPVDKFEQRRFRMAELWHEAAQVGFDHFELPEEDDNPFVDFTYELIGDALVPLGDLSHLIDANLPVNVMSLRSAEVIGKLTVKFAPLDKFGHEADERDSKDAGELDPFVDDPKVLLGKTISYRVYLPQFECFAMQSQLFFRYRMDGRDSEEAWSKTPELPGQPVVRWDGCHTHALHVSAEVLEHLTQGRMYVQLWGLPVQSAGRNGPSFAEMKAQLTKLKEELATAKDGIRERDEIIAERDAELTKATSELEAERHARKAAERMADVLKLQLKGAGGAVSALKSTKNGTSDVPSPAADGSIAPAKTKKASPTVSAPKSPAAADAAEGTAASTPAAAAAAKAQLKALKKELKKKHKEFEVLEKSPDTTDKEKKKAAKQLRALQKQCEAVAAVAVKG